MAFNLLSLEINEHIATYLDTDREVCDFRLICHATDSAIEAYRCGVWRDRYAKRYDMPEKKGGREIMMLYKVRSKLLRKGARFLMGLQPREVRCLKVLRDLVVESYANLPAGQNAKHPSNNLEAIRRFVQDFGMSPKTTCHLAEKCNVNPLLQTLRLVLTHLELSIPLARASPALGFAYSQKACYTSPDMFPMCDTSDGTGTWRVSMELLLHIATFFKFHLTQKGESTLYEIFSELKTHEKPKAWNSRLEQGRGVKKLGTNWKGTYAYLHDLHEMDLIRRCEPGKKYVFLDSIDHHDGFQTLQFDFEPQNNRAHWPKIFESHLNAMPTSRLCDLLDRASKPSSKGGRDQGQAPPSPPKTPSNKKKRIGTTELPVPQTKKKPHRSPTTSSSSSTILPKRGVHYQQFSGSGNDAEPFHCKGILHPLPPQEGIPGWYRISMMKYFDPLSPSADNNNNNNNNGTWGSLQSPPSSSSEEEEKEEKDGSSGANGYNNHTNKSSNHDNDMYQITDDAEINAGCWAYEGVVLPGGMIMLGRWWSPMDDTGLKRCMGPFVFWNVDE